MMEYFLLQQDERIYNTIHIPVLSLLKYTDYKNYNLETLSPMTVLTREGSEFEEYPDLLSSIFLVSEELNKIINLFVGDMKYKLFCFWDNQKNIPFYYYAYNVPSVKCLSEKSIITNGGTIVSKLILNRKLVQNKDIFRVDGLEKHLILVSLPVAEAILRRNFKGIRLLETYYDE